jgi:hypothetical protein
MEPEDVVLTGFYFPILALQLQVQESKKNKQTALCSMHFPLRPVI